MIKNKFRPAFTIVELIVAISVIAILSGIVLVSYGSWRTSTATSSLKSDLEHAASQTESYRTFNSTYPVPFTLINFTPSANNTITPTYIDAKSFCLDGTTTISSSVKYYIDNLTQANGATSGTCAARTSLPIPGVVTTVAFTTSSTQITVSWVYALPNYASGYLAQCALDPGFITGLIQVTTTQSTDTQTTISGANAQTTYYCRVRAVNTNGQSDWSGSSNGNTQQRTCTDTNQYGTYPDCYNYDSLPAGTSIAGYWTTLPTEYLLEDGSAVSRTTYADLFAAIGTTYGVGDGSTTFNVPDSRGRVAVNKNTSDAEFATLGQKYGEKTHTLTVTEMPTHSHNFVFSGGQSSSYPYTGSPNIAAGLAFSVGSPTYGAVGISSTGGDTAHNVIQPSIVEMFAIKYRPSTGTSSVLAAASSIQGYWATAPTGYLLEDGSAVSRTTYADLFAAIGTTYGVGDGSTTFNVPDSRGRVAVNKNTSDAEFATLGQKYGEKTHTLTVAEMASHSHNFTYAGSQYAALPYTGSPNTSYGLAFSVGSPTYGAISISSTGGGIAYNVVQPSFVKVSAIKYTLAVGTVEVITTASSIQGYWSSAPSGYLAEDGSAVSRTTYANLFAAIGTTNGVGDGSTTFNVPDSRGRVAVNKSTSDVEFATIGQKYGEKTHLLTVAELPSHSHNWVYSGGQSGSYPYTGSPNTSYGLAFSVGSPTYGAISISSVGGNQAHNVIQPSIVKLFAIKY